MRRLTINGKEYTVEFSIEASLYSECTEAAMNLVMGFGEAQGELDGAKEENMEEAKSRVRAAIRKTFSSLVNIPSTAMTLFYAGLLEHHHVSMTEAKELIGQYLRENGSDFVEVLNLMLECMGEDHFFELTGLSRVLGDQKQNETPTESPKKKSKKTGAG